MANAVVLALIVVGASCCGRRIVELAPNGRPTDARTTRPPIPSGAKRVFVTVATFTGNLGGLGGGDRICHDAAIGAQLGGSWKVWLSDATTNAADRIDDVGPWYDVDGAEVFHNKAQLTSAPLVGLSTEHGSGPFPAHYAWTGTDARGIRSELNTCDSWSTRAVSTYGLVGEALPMPYGVNWTASARQSCSDRASLFCFEQ